MATRLPGKYITAAAKKTKSPKRRMKLAWELWEKAKRAAARLRKTGTKKKGTKKKSSSKKTSSSKAVTVKKKSASVKKKSNPKSHNPKKGKRTMKTLVSPKTLGMITNAGIGAVGLVGSTVAFNKIPVIKDWKPWQKMLAQAVVGVIGMTAFLKFKWLFLLFFGGLTGAAATAMLEYLPAGLKGRTFTPTEMKQLTQGIKNYNQRMNVPLDYKEQPYQSLGVPITTNMGMGMSYGMGVHSSGSI